MQGKRRHERYNVDTADISGKMLLAKFLKILNISIGGICFQTEKRLNLGSQYTIKLNGKGRSLDVRGVVVWSTLRECIKDARGNIVPIYTAGMKFVDIPAEKVTEIVNFIDDHRWDGDRTVDIFKASGPRLFVRIQIENPENAALDYHYRVKNLSLGGVLIESVHALELERRLPMELELGGGRTFTFLGRVAYCLEVSDETGEHYDIGIDFTEISEKDKGVVREFIASLKKTDEGVSVQ